MKSLDSYLSSPPRGFAFLLKGSWGAGKSYFWKHYCGSPANQHRKAITISAAGLETLSDLQTAVLIAALPGTGVAKELGMVAGRALLKYLQLESTDEMKLQSALSTGVSVICIDDVERFSGKFEILFGFVISLLDRAGIHCVLIADESQTIRKFEDYGRYRERVVGSEAFFAPSLEVYMDYAIAEVGSSDIRELLESQRNELVGIFREKSVKNLRTIRRFLLRFEEVMDSLDPKQRASIAVESLQSCLLFWAVAEGFDASCLPDVADAFAHECIAFAVVSRRVAGDDPSGVASGAAQRCVDLIVALDFATETHRWPVSAALAAYVRDGEVDAACIAKDFEVDASRERSSDYVTRLQEFFMRDSDVDLQADIRLALQEVESGFCQSLRRFGTLCDTLLVLSEFRLTEQDGAELEELFKRRIEQGLEIAEDHDVELEIAHGLGYLAKVGSLLAPIRATLREKIEASARRQMLERILGDQASEVDPRTHPFLSGEDMERLCASLRQGSATAQKRLADIFRYRTEISNAREVLSSDGPGALRLAQEIEAGLPGQRPWKLEDARMYSIASAARAFAKHVGAA